MRPPSDVPPSGDARGARATRGTRATRDARDALAAIGERLQPRANRRAVERALEELFREGRAPEPAPDGFLPGRFVSLSVAAPLDTGARALSGWWMPWLGKSFDRDGGAGINVLAPAARLPMKLWWPGYQPGRRADGRLEAFPFRTRVASSAVTPGSTVLALDYDADINPRLIVRHILDELVQVDDGLYLGRMLYRWRGAHRPLGWFTLGS